MTKSKAVIGFLVGVIVGLTVASVTAGTRPDYREEMINDFFPPLVWLVTQIERRYVDDVDLKDLAIGAYDGILSRLDKYSAYIPPDRRDEFEADTKGEFGGLGITIRYLPIKKAVLVEHAIPGTPAFAAGVLPGDMIIEVLEESTGEKFETADFKDVHDAVRILRGKPGSKVDTDRRIGYIYVAYFHEQTVNDLKKALAELRRQGAQGVVLDLRFNPGGLLKSAVEFADLFLDGDVIVSTEGKHEPEHVMRAHSGDAYPDLSLAVLVNRFSASASEIVAAALGENGRAVIVGEPTYGKASVQTLMDDPVTNGAVKLTTAHYYTPMKNMIEGEGVKPDPDALIKLSDEDLVRLRVALVKLTQYPPVPEEEEPSAAEPAEEPGAEATPEAAAEPETAQAEEQKEFRDVQLDRAVELLEEMVVRRASPEPQPVAAAAPVPQS